MIYPSELKICIKTRVRVKMEVLLANEVFYLNMVIMIYRKLSWDTSFFEVSPSRSSVGDFLLGANKSTLTAHYGSGYYYEQ